MRSDDMAPLLRLEDPALSGAREARVALLGEMTHGTAEFYESRAALSLALAEEGALVVGLEADWPDAAVVDAYVRGRRDDLAPWYRYARWPMWMWRNRQFLDFVETLRAHNTGRDEADQVMVCGLDLYSMSESITAVLLYLQKKDPQLAAVARRRYDCLARFREDPAQYGHAVMRRLADCRDEAVAMLTDLLERRVEHSAAEGFDAAQNARLVAGAQEYYRSVYDARVSSWNVRDGHMRDTLEAVLGHRGPEAKAVVWAHNSHVGDARGSELGATGETTLGTLVRQWTDAWSLGQFSDRGTVMAGRTWEATPEVMQVRPSRPDSHGAWLSGENEGTRIMSTRGTPQKQRLERAIGVVYRPDTERMSHYFLSSLPERFDAVTWWPQTRAVDALHVPEAPAPPDLWPSAM